jgi:hypothetical protein
MKLRGGIWVPDSADAHAYEAELRAAELLAAELAGTLPIRLISPEAASTQTNYSEKQDASDPAVAMELAAEYLKAIGK